MEQVNQEDLAVVKEVHPHFILVEMQRGEACASCGLHGFCHTADNPVTHKIYTEETYRVGDLFQIEISAGVRIVTSLLVFLVPILLMILFYTVARFALNFSDSLAIPISFGGLLLSGLIIAVIDKKYGRKVNFEIKNKVEK